MYGPPGREDVTYVYISPFWVMSGQKVRYAYMSNQMPRYAVVSGTLIASPLFSTSTDPHMRPFASRRLCAALLMLAALLVAGPATAAPSAAPADLTLTESPDTMAAYCTVQDVKDVYDAQELASLTGDPNRATIDDEKVQLAVDDYGAYMERHVRMQHPDNPFDESDEFLNSLNAEGAYLYLKQRAEGGGDEEVRKELRDLDKVLMRIAQGELDLMDPEEIDNAGEKLVPGDLIEKRKSGTEFGIHRRLPGYLNA